MAAADRTVLINPSPVLLGAGAVIAQIFYPLVYGSTQDLLTIASVLLFFAASLTHAALTRGRQVVLALLTIFTAGGLLVEGLGLATGFPFGRYTYDDRLGPMLLGVPVVVALAWTMMAWPSWLVAGRLVRHRRWLRILVAAWGLASWDLFLDPQLVSAGHWTWAHPDPGLPGVANVPLTNVAGWVLVAFLLMLAFDRFSGDRLRPVDPYLDAAPLGLFLWVYASSALALVAFFNLPAAALWGAVGMGVVVMPLVGDLERYRAAR